MSVAGQSLINLLVYLVIIVIVIVILFWILDRFLMVAPLIQYSDAITTDTFCNEIVDTGKQLICKLV